jgi:hypothetical protein
MSDDNRTISLKKSKIFIILVLIVATAGVALIIIFALNQMANGTIPDGGG